MPPKDDDLKLEGTPVVAQTFPIDKVIISPQVWNDILSHMPPSYGVSIDDIVGVQPMAAPPSHVTIEVKPTKPLEFIQVEIVLAPENKEDRWTQVGDELWQE